MMPEYQQIGANKIFKKKVRKKRYFFLKIVDNINKIATFAFREKV